MLIWIHRGRVRSSVRPSVGPVLFANDKLCRFLSSESLLTTTTTISPTTTIQQEPTNVDLDGSHFSLPIDNEGLESVGDGCQTPTKQLRSIERLKIDDACSGSEDERDASTPPPPGVTPNRRAKVHIKARIWMKALSHSLVRSFIRSFIRSHRSLIR